MKPNAQRRMKMNAKKRVDVVPLDDVADGIVHWNWMWKHFVDVVFSLSCLNLLI